MKRIPLRNKAGRIIAWTSVDDDDYRKLSMYRWCRHSAGYACRSTAVGDRTVFILMHRAILNPGPGMEVDHKDRRKLNNTRKNIRCCTSAQNKWNAAVSPRNTSGHRGVSWNSHERAWCAAIQVNKRSFFLGRYRRKADAVLARETANRHFYGEYAP